MKMSNKDLLQLIRSIILEGGLKLPSDKRVDLTPALVREACSLYIEFIDGWNLWLRSKGKEPVKAIKPSGSSSHAEQDDVEGLDVIYGDVDYLVSFPYSGSETEFGNKRKQQAHVEKEYTDLLREYILTGPDHVDVDMTLKENSSPLMIVMILSKGQHVQVDTVVTFPEYSDWMKGRYTPERGIKGYTIGNLYKSLGDYLTLTIGTQGVVARTKNGQRVSSNQRAGVSYEKISNNFSNFLVDIAEYLIGEDVKLSDKLMNHPGLDSEAVSISDFATGIVGLAETLHEVGIFDKRDMLSSILESYRENMNSNVQRKVDHDIDPSKVEKLLKLNDQQYERVKKIFQQS